MKLLSVSCVSHSDLLPQPTPPVIATGVNVADQTVEASCRAEGVPLPVMNAERTLPGIVNASAAAGASRASAPSSSAGAGGRFRRARDVLICQPRTNCRLVSDSVLANTRARPLPCEESAFYDRKSASYDRKSAF